MTFHHDETGLRFGRIAGRKPVHLTGNTYEHRQALHDVMAAERL